NGGFTDLYILSRDGTVLRRLTHAEYADLHPSWSPDGKTIAFVTDRGGETDFETLRFGNLRIALYRLGGGTIEMLGTMRIGKNIDPVWSPDGRSLAFVSDRTGIANVFLYDFADGQIYQLTNMFTGVQGITPLSPVLSWAPQADRLAFVYYEDGQYSVYSVENPRSLRRGPYHGPAAPPVTLLLAEQRDTIVTAAPIPAPPVALPDTNEFSFKPYKVRFSTDYIVRPTVGYSRDNFGRGIFGGTAIAMSDILGNHSVVIAGSINGRISEAQFLGLYVNQTHRLNWASGFSQDPLYFYGGSDWTTVPNSQGTADSLRVYTSRIRRFVIRDGIMVSSYPFNRFIS